MNLNLTVTKQPTLEHNNIPCLQLDILKLFDQSRSVAGDILDFSSLLGSGEKIPKLRNEMNSCRVTEHYHLIATGDYKNTFPPLPCQGDSGERMSRFKDVTGKWRNNERQAVLDFFDCRLKHYVDTVLGRGGISTLAILLGVSTTTVSQWVHGITMPPSDKQYHIAQILGIQPSEIWIYRKDLFPVATEVVRQQKKLNTLMAQYKNQLQEFVEENS